MSSYQLSLTLPTPSKSPISLAPVHASFSSSLDLLATVHNDGMVEVWDLTSSHTGSKVARPVQLWRGSFAADLSAPLIGRQIVVWTLPPTNINEPKEFGFAVLGTPSIYLDERPTDEISTVLIASTGDIDRSTITLPSSGTGRLVSSGLLGLNCFWQDSTGELFKGGTNQMFHRFIL